MTATNVTGFWNKPAFLAMLCLFYLLIPISVAAGNSPPFPPAQRPFVCAYSPETKTVSSDGNSTSAQSKNGVAGRRRSLPDQQQNQYEQQSTKRLFPVQYSKNARKRVSLDDTNTAEPPSRSTVASARRPPFMQDDSEGSLFSSENKNVENNRAVPDKEASQLQEQHTGTPQTYGNLNELESAINAGDGTRLLDPTQKQQRLPHSPVIYRYYGKSRSRTQASGSVPFILMGNVDHWRMTGEQLAARGFSVIACERGLMDPSDDENQKVNEKEVIDAHNNGDNAQRDFSDNWWKGADEEGGNLVLNVLQASRWSKAILVACDDDAVMAVQAAMRLAPEKIAGLVLCGNLERVDRLIQKSHAALQSHGCFAIDAFLSQLLPCPFAIAWDGEPSAENGASSPAASLHGTRCFILGGGMAPHRRQPATFAWTLTRFVEDKVAPSIPSPSPVPNRQKLQQQKGARQAFVAAEREQHNRRLRFPRIVTDFLFGDYFSTGSFVVYGRFAAWAILYGTLLHVGVFQYGMFLDAMTQAKSQYDMVSALRHKLFGLISGTFHFGYLFRLFGQHTGAVCAQGDVFDLRTVESPKEIEEEAGAEAESDDSIEKSKAEAEAESDDSIENSKENTHDKNQKEVDDDNAVEESPGKYYPPLFFLDRVNA